MFDSIYKKYIDSCLDNANMSYMFNDEKNVNIIKNKLEYEKKKLTFKILGV
jgi:hypothetical protein